MFDGYVHTKNNRVTEKGEVRIRIRMRHQNHICLNIMLIRNQYNLIQLRAL